MTYPSFFPVIFSLLTFTGNIYTCTPVWVKKLSSLAFGNGLGPQKRPTGEAGASPRPHGRKHRKEASPQRMPSTLCFLSLLVVAVDSTLNKYLVSTYCVIKSASMGKGFEQHLTQSQHSVMCVIIMCQQSTSNYGGVKKLVKLSPKKNCKTGQNYLKNTTSRPGKSIKHKETEELFTEDCENYR